MSTSAERRCRNCSHHELSERSISGTVSHVCLRCGRTNRFDDSPARHVANQVAVAPAPSPDISTSPPTFPPPDYSTSGNMVPFVSVRLRIQWLPIHLATDGQSGQLVDSLVIIEKESINESSFESGVGSFAPRTYFRLTPSVWMIFSMSIEKKFPRRTPEERSARESIFAYHAIDLLEQIVAQYFSSEEIRDAVSQGLAGNLKPPSDPLKNGQIPPWMIS